MTFVNVRRAGRVLCPAVLVLLAAFLLAARPAAAASTSTASAAATVSPGQVPPDTVRARITGAPILGTSNQNIPPAEAAPTILPSKSGQIATLKAALAYMTAHYPQLADFTPGPQDIFDYGVGNLWRQGVDGAGTTIALLEGWNDPSIAQTVASFDASLDLPNPKITTIYPAGPLPAKCPEGMVVLGSYGSCDAWEGELTLDVITAHMIAPYANILLAVTPADTVIHADPAQNVAPPEMMEAVEDIANNHLANVISVSDGTGEGTYYVRHGGDHRAESGRARSGERRDPIPRRDRRLRGCPEPRRGELSVRGLGHVAELGDMGRFTVDDSRRRKHPQREPQERRQARARPTVARPAAVRPVLRRGRLLSGVLAPPLPGWRRIDHRQRHALRARSHDGRPGRDV